MVAISATARAVGMVTRCPSAMMPIVPMNPTCPTAYPNLRKRMAPRMVEMVVMNTGRVPKFGFVVGVVLGIAISCFPGKIS